MKSIALPCRNDSSTHNLAAMLRVPSIHVSPRVKHLEMSLNVSRTPCLRLQLRGDLCILVHWQDKISSRTLRQRHLNKLQTLRIVFRIEHPKDRSTDLLRYGFRMLGMWMAMDLHPQQFHVGVEWTEGGECRCPDRGLMRCEDVVERAMRRMVRLKERQ